MRRFDAATWEKNKTQRVVTRSGFRDVKVFAVVDGRVFGATRDKDYRFPEWESESWSSSGSYMKNMTESGLDLMFADPAPEPTEEEIDDFLEHALSNTTQEYVDKVEGDQVSIVIRYAIKRIRDLEGRP